MSQHLVTIYTKELLTNTIKRKRKVETGKERICPFLVNISNNSIFI